jgi:hypothetical protein
MKNPPMPNNPDEEKYRQLLRKIQTPADITDENQKLMEQYSTSIGTKRVVEIAEEEGIDLAAEIERQATEGTKKIFAIHKEAIQKLDSLVNPEGAKAVGELLMSHLRLENLIDHLLLDNLKKYDNPDIISKAKLRFWQKLQLLTFTGSVLSPVIAFINDVNDLRNKYAHDIHFDFENCRDFRAINKAIDDDIRQFPGNISKFQRLMARVKGVEYYLMTQIPSYKKKMAQINTEFPILKHVISNEGKTIIEKIKK